MELKKLYSKINLFETQDNIKHFGSEYGNLWPLFRMQIFDMFLKNKNSLKYRNKLYRTLSDIKQLTITRKKYPFKIKNNPTINYDATEIWFSSCGHRNENKYNKYLDPFFFKLAEKNAIIFENSKTQAPFYSIHSANEYNIENIYPLLLRFKAKRFFKTLLFNDYASFQKKAFVHILNNKFPEYNTYGFFINYKQFVETYNFYLHIFSKYPNLKRTFLVAYYFTDGMAISAAGKKLHVETIDIKHGQQSVMHYGYGAWGYIPEDGYSLLPSNFYVFSKQGADHFQTVLKNKHKATIVKNYSLLYWKQNSNDITKNKKSIILISLQNEINYSNSILLNALKTINNRHPQINIVFRLHPRHTYIKNEQEQILEQIKLKYKWDKNEDIYDTLAETIINLTSFSSVVEDALLFGVQSIIFTEKGAEIYKDMINEKKVHKALNKDDLVEIINKYIEK